jgi:hypothetical protein
MATLSVRRCSAPLCARYTERLQTADDRNWGTWDAYICGRSLSGGVETTPEGQSLDWDGALDGALTAKDISVKKTANG